MSDPAISVVIRAKNEAPAIGRTLDLLERQTVADRTEIVVVDSGSTDGTLDIVRARDVRLIEIPAASFTYGGALNTGTEQARAEVVVALSAHSFPLDDGWLERVLAAMADPNVACASGQGVGPDGARLERRVIQDLALAREHPLWGYSSHAGAFRRSLWAQRPFRADMPFSEDKEWAWHWLQQGRTAVLAPDLIVDHGHGEDPLREQLRRGYLHWVGVSMFLPVERQSVRALLREWWRERESYENPWRARLSPKRLARLAGAFAGRRVGARRS
ncbi:MAG: glycosyl transferase family 2 [Solirubrobacterales bacterium]|nr:glycosyl transferase family 2 [Solirubrobacterales bacterium]